MNYRCPKTSCTHNKKVDGKNYCTQEDIATPMCKLFYEEQVFDKLLISTHTKHFEDNMADIEIYVRMIKSLREIELAEYKVRRAARGAALVNR